MYDFVLDDSESKGGYWWFIECSPAGNGWLIENAPQSSYWQGTTLRIEAVHFHDLIRHAFHAGLKAADTNGRPIYCSCGECPNG